MSGIASRQRDLEAEFTAIELAVKETERGRWFLEEFARRNRHADTGMLLSALSRIERSVGAQREAVVADNLRLDILEMSRVIARTRSEIAAIKSSSEEPGPIVEASGELDSIVASTESATSSILAAAEKIQAAAWTLRANKADVGMCDALDTRATEIFVACTFQDLTAQRTRKVIETLTFIEQRLDAMADLWKVSSEGGPSANAAPDKRPAMSQSDVDSVLVGDNDPSGVQSSAGRLAPREAMPSVAGAEAIDEILFTEPLPGPPPETARLQLVSSQVETISAEPTPVERPAVDEALKKVRAGQTLSSDEATRALDMLQGLSVEERARLFS